MRSFHPSWTESLSRTFSKLHPPSMPFSLVMGFAPLLFSHASCEMLVEAAVFSPCSGGGSELLEVVDVEWPQLVAQ